tara:strand:+ start:247 stop:846 length:600 start_codon:yes stop_codon:yes gene_type:complete
MQIKVKDNSKQLAKKLTAMQKKQIPFATAQAINNTLFGLRKEMAKQTVKKLDRPVPFTQRGFLVTKAKKTNLVGVLRIKPEVESYLQYQIDGGVRKPSSKKIPVPITKNKRLNKYGNIAGKRGGLVKGSKEFIATIGGATGVWKENRKGQPPTLLIKFHDSVKYSKKPFDFYKIGRGYINGTYNRQLTKALAKALRTAK